MTSATIKQHAPEIGSRGVTITTSGTSAVSGIPVTETGSTPSTVRLSATAACYARLGRPSEGSAVISAAGTGYVPGEKITLTGGTFTSAMVLAVATTKVVSATVTSAGTDGTPGSATVTGTTGTGTKFQATVTIGAGGDITSVDSISVAGSYTVNPTDITDEPVTGGGLVGATLSVVMGVATVTNSYGGFYSALPTNPVSQGSTTGVGTGATFTVTFTTAAAAGDVLVNPNDALYLSAKGFSTVAAIQVSSGGVLQVSPVV